MKTYQLTPYQIAIEEERDECLSKANYYALNPFNNRRGMKEQEKARKLKKEFWDDVYAKNPHLKGKPLSTNGHEFWLLNEDDYKEATARITRMIIYAAETFHNFEELMAYVRGIRDLANNIDSEPSHEPKSEDTQHD